MLKFSIVTPSFNQGQYIEETILSVLNQSYTNWELIIIDGGSTDNTVEIIKKYQKYLKYWISEKDEGQSDAIIKGLKHCTGDIINWINSDDTLELDALERIANYFNQEPQIDILHGKTWLVRYNEKPFADGIAGPLLQHDYLSYMHVPQPSTFMRKQVFVECGISMNLHYGMDFELVAKAILLGYNIKKVEDVFSKLLVHESSKSNYDIRFLNDWAKVVGTIFNTYKKHNYTQVMLQLNIIHTNSEEIYEKKINLSDTELELIFLEHLHKQFHIRYKNLLFEDSLGIGNYIKNNFSKYYIDKNFSKFETRMKYVPKFLFKWIR